MSDQDKQQLSIADDEYRASLERALEQVGIGVVISRDGRVSYASQTHLEILGYSLEELSSVSYVEFVDDTQRDEVQQRLEQRRAGVDVDVAPLDVRTRHASGRSIVLNVVSAPLPGPGTNLLTLTRDVTEERAFERRTEHAQRMEALGHLCGGIAHDFNNYLTAVRMLGEALADSDDPSERAALFAELEGVTRGAARLTNHLQTFSAAEPQRRAVVDLNIVVFEMAEMLRRITGRQVELALNLEPGLPPAQVNAAQLQQMVVNLVLNASQAMRDGGRVTVRTSAADGKVTLEVHDDGQGMPPEVLARAFEPLFTTEPDQRSGMGLAIVYGIARQCDGEVAIESEPGAGTTIRVEIPRSEGPPRKRPPVETAEVGDDVALSVLIVESTEEPIGGLVESGLHRAGLAVERCPLSDVEGRDLGFAALVMTTPPPSDATSVIERYLTEENGRIVFISTPPALDDEVWESGRLIHLPKPFSASELVAVISGEDPATTT